MCDSLGSTWLAHLPSSLTFRKASPRPEVAGAEAAAADAAAEGAAGDASALPPAAAISCAAASDALAAAALLAWKMHPELKPKVEVQVE